MYFYGFFQTEMLMNFFIWYRWAEAVTWKTLSWKTRICVVQKRDPKPGSL